MWRQITYFAGFCGFFTKTMPNTARFPFFANSIKPGQKFILPHIGNPRWILFQRMSNIPPHFPIALEKRLVFIIVFSQGFFERFKDISCKLFQQFLFILKIKINRPRRNLGLFGNLCMDKFGKPTVAIKSFVAVKIRSIISVSD